MLKINSYFNYEGKKIQEIIEDYIVLYYNEIHNDEEIK